MRSDYMLYAVAIIFFILTGVVAAYSIEQQQLWIVTTAVLGLAFIALGYTQRPKPTSTATTPTTTAETTAITVPTPSPPPLAHPAATEIVKGEEAETVTETGPPSIGLTRVKGIKEKRAAQLKAVGINTIEDLAKASARDLGTKLKISPKITVRWIENAKEILAKP